MRVLVACEYSGTVRRAFAALGHDAWSCDLLPCDDGSPNHIQGDVLPVAGRGDWDLMIAHPPCTYLAVSGARWLYNKDGSKNQERYNNQQEAIEFVGRLMNAPIKYKAIENPISVISTEIRKPNQIIQPYQFGHEYSKRTHLWLKGLPNLIPTDIKENYMPYLPSNTGGAKRGQKATPKSINQKESSKTFTGVAKAMAEQWSVVLTTRT